MTGDDPILAAGTVAELLGAANTAYGWTYPVAVPDGTALAALWAQPITVAKDPTPGVLYRASGSAALPVGTGLAGDVLLQILDQKGPTA